MTQNNSLAMANRLPARADDAWGQQALAPGGGGGGAPVSSPIQRVHRVLRGRYILAGVLAAVCAAGGAWLGYKSQAPTYRSVGAIEIRPTMDRMNDSPVVIPMYTQYMGTQAEVIQSPRVIQMAMKSDEWAVLNRGASQQSIADFTENLEVRRPGDTYLIQVLFTDEDPKAASAAVRAVIRAYQEIYDDADGRELRNQIAYVDTERNQIDKEIRSRQDQVLALSREHGSPENVTTFHNAAVQELVRILSQLNEAQIQLAVMESASKPREDKGGKVDPNSLTAMQIASVDPNMAAMLVKKEQLEFNLNTLMKTLGENHRSVVSVRAELEFQNKRIDDYIEQYRRQYGNQLANPVGPASAATIDQQRERAMTLGKMYDKQMATVTALSDTSARIGKLKLEIDQFQQKMDENAKKMDRLKVREAFSGQMRVISYGDDPNSPWRDKRKQAGVVGFVGGATLPIALLMFLGLLDQRYRYSDEAGGGMGGMALLGILPDLPDLLTDPDQAAVAAHCVHQIRTMLQIGGHGDDRRVYAVTSATPGDGKTSLTLALGLSFAASGSRTLLIDADLVGGGLTHRLNVRTAEGILEAINDRMVLEHVQPTEVSDLAILPVGGAHAHHASSISPAAVRRLIAEARKHYDTVLIDTGPILGSIEASGVAANADAVILVVSRKQQRPMVEKALGQLASIRANVAGVVFNRAQTRDFEKSVSRMSMRSMPARENGSGNGKPPAASGGGARKGYGPVAHAVAKSFKPGEGSDDEG